MGLRFPSQLFGQCFFVTTSFKDRRRYGDIFGLYPALARSLAFCLDKYDSKAIGYVFMPSHIHALLVIEGNRLPNSMRDFKKFISQKEAKGLGITEPTIWQYRYDRVAISTENVLRIKLEYIHANPVRSGLVGKAEDWPWSSAGDYLSGRPGVIPIWKDWF